MNPAPSDPGTPGAAPGAPSAWQPVNETAAGLARLFEQPVRGRAYTAWARWSTASTVVALFAWGVALVDQQPQHQGAVLALLAAGGGLLVVSAWFILTGHTTIDAQGIRQDWIFRKQFDWHQIAAARLVRLPLQPRLLLSTGRGPIRAIHGGDAAVIEAFRRVDAYYRQIRAPLP